MTFFVLGQIIFTTLQSPSELEKTGEFKFAEHPVAFAPPRLQAMARELQTINFTIILHAALGSPEARLNQLEAAMLAANAMPLVLGNGNLVGNFVIIRMTETSRKYTATGSIVLIEVRISLKEYVAGAAVDPNAPPQPATTPPALVQVTAAEAAATPGGVAGTIVTNASGVPSVVFLKDNAGASALLNNPGPGGPPSPNLDYTDVPAAAMVRAPA
jgi:phage protein U